MNLIFGLETHILDFFCNFYLPNKLAWKNIWKEYPVFWAFLKISISNFGPFKSKLFKFEKSTKSALKKFSYNRNFKNLARKLWLWHTNWYVFWDTLFSFWPGNYLSANNFCLFPYLQTSSFVACKKSLFLISLSKTYRQVSYRYSKKSFTFNRLHILWNLS